MPPWAGRRAPAVIQCHSDAACPCEAEPEEQLVQRGLLDDLASGAMGLWDSASSLASEIARLTGLGIECQLRLMILPPSVLLEIVHMINAGRPLEPSILVENRTLLELVCDCLPDVVVVWLARNVYLSGKPLAQAHVDHYLHGGGADYPEDVATFIRTDAGARGAVIRQINEAGSGQTDYGHGFTDNAIVRQTEYQNQDYRMAFGNICCPNATGEPPGYLRFTVLDTPEARARNRAAGNTAQVRLVMHDPYGWHPEEERISQCIHRAFENRKAHGAADFMQVGEATIDLEIHPLLIPK